MKRRRAAGWIGAAATVAAGAILCIAGVSPYWRLAVVVPAAASAAGFLQARARFCAGLGLAGKQHVSADGPAVSVEEGAQRRRDRARALRIIGVATLIGAAAALALFLVPVGRG